MLTAVGASAQTDYTSYLDNGTWTRDEGYNGNDGTYQGGQERYGDAITGSASSPTKVLYETVTGLPAGTYTLQLYAVANNAWVGSATGDNIAQVYVTANETTQTENVTVYDQTSFAGLAAYPHTFTVTVGSDGTLEYGLWNVGNGGNWYVCQGWNLTRTDETTPALEAGAVLDECVADLTHWATTGNNGSFELNDHSSENDESGMVTPFLQNWVYNTSNLTTATISHRPLTGLPNGYYSLSLDIRIFSEAGHTIGTGTTFNANETYEDLDNTNLDGHEGTYNGETEVYGTYHLLLQVTEGTLDINIQLPSSPTYNWIAWKNLKASYLGEDPTLSIVEGDMNASVYEEMVAAVAAWNNSLTDQNLFAAAEAAILAAEESIAQYAEIAALVANLDTNGASVWANSTSGQAYTAKTLATSDDFSDDMVAAQLAQTTTGSDLSYTLQNSGSWIGNSGFITVDGLSTAEAYANTDADWADATGYPVGKVLYKNIDGLQVGATYEVSFYAEANTCTWHSSATGTGIAQVFANDEAVDITVNSYNAVGNVSGHQWLESDFHTFTCTVGDDGVLQFGLQNVAQGGSWYTCREVSLKLVALAGEEVIDWEMTDAGWGTLILPFAADVPTGLTLYAGDALTLDSEGTTITVGEEAESIEANVPYLVKGAEGTYSFNGTIPENEDDSYTVGMLTGTLVDMAQDDFTVDSGQYVLQNHTDGEGLAFYQITSESEGVTLEAYHCYLTSAVAPTALHLPGMATAIKSVESDVIANDAIYDLSGRRVAKAVKGVYIMNGKKVLVK